MEKTTKNPLNDIPM